MTVNITGMHRTGTSMGARLLKEYGLYLGPEEGIMRPDEGNPAGYWQNLAMDQVTEDLLAHQAGGWDFLLPPLPEGWADQPGIEPFRQRGRDLIQTMSQREPWGWKDPRCSLTLPFWKSLLPGLRVVVCLRNPVETARSLSSHVGSTDAFNFNLWHRYYQRLLADSSSDERLITHYDMFFVDPAGELARIVDWLGWAVSAEQMERALQTISPALRQQRLSSEELEAVRVPLAVAETYETLCALAGGGLVAAIRDGVVPHLVQDITDGDRLPDTDTTPPARKEDAEQAFTRAHGLIDQGKIEEAIVQLQIAVAQHPFHVRARSDLGVLHLTQANYNEALAQLTAASHLDPNNSDTAKNLAGAYLKVGRAEDAIQTFLDIVDRNPHDVDALFWLGTACSQLGQKEQAVRLFARVLELEPDHGLAKTGLEALQ